MAGRLVGTGAKIGGSDTTAVPSAFEPQPDIRALKKDVDKQFEEMKAMFKAIGKN